MKDHRLTAGMLRRRWVLAAALTASAAFALPGVAAASPSKHGSVYSAAHAQYGPQKVLKPAKSTVPAVAAVKSAASKGKPGKTTKQVATLPFTGIGLLKIALVGIALLGAGIVLRLRGADGNR